MADTITTLHPENNTDENLYPNIKAENIPDNAITTSKIANGSINASKMGYNSINGTTHIINGSITNEKMDINSISTTNLQNGSITNEKMDINSVDSDNIVNNAITTGKIQDQAVTTSKIENGSITNQKMATNSVTTANLQNDSVTSSKLSSAVRSEINSKVDITNLSINPVASSVPYRNANGNLKATSPVDDDDVATKEYVAQALNVTFDNKLDKVTNQTSTHQIYGKQGNGTQTMFSLERDTTTGLSIPQRTSNGTIRTAQPLVDNDTANKKYVDDNCSLTPKNTWSLPLVANSFYTLGMIAQQGAVLPIILPNQNVKVGSEIAITFITDEYPVTLEWNTEVVNIVGDYDYIETTAFTRTEINCLWDGYFWSVIVNEQEY